MKPEPVFGSEASGKPQELPAGGTSRNPMEGTLAYVVDDEALVGEVAANALKRAGLKPVVFQSSVVAWSAFMAAHPRPKLLVTDFLMKSLNGLELIERCKQAEPGLKTILFSGSVGFELVERYAIQPDRFINKPFDLGVLVETARKILQD